MRALRFLGGLLVCAALSGCATVPQLPDNDRLPIDAVIRNVRCEITQALSSASDEYVWLRNSAVAFQLTLKVEEKGDGSADTAFTFPISNGTFTIGFTAGLAEKALAKSELYMASKYDDFDLQECPNAKFGPTDSALTGELGLATWLERSASAIQSSAVKVMPSEKDTYIAHQVEFVLTASGSVSPKFNIVRTGGRTRSGLFKFGASREETNTLRIVVKPLPGRVVAIRREKTGRELSVPYIARDRPTSTKRLDPGLSEELRDILRGLKDDDSD
jgi:hypothetical protein